jgi:hypothetical protein
MHERVCEIQGETGPLMAMLIVLMRKRISKLHRTVAAAMQGHYRQPLGAGRWGMGVL